MSNIDLLIGRCGELSPGLEHNVRMLVATYVDLGRAESTIDTYVRQLRLIAEHHGSDPADWTRDDQDALIRNKWFMGLSKASKDTTVSVLKAYWGMLYRRDLLEHSTFFKARKERGAGRDKRSLKALSLPQADVEAAIDECRIRIREGTDAQVYRHYPLLLQACFGLRNVAVSYLRECDLRFNERVIQVHDDKGGKDHDVPMDMDVYEEHCLFMAARERIIGDLRTRCAGQEDIVFARLDALLAPDGPLFFKRDIGKGNVGERIERGTLGTMTSRVLSQALGKKAHAHMLRHSKVFYLLEVKRLTAHQVAKYIGHDNINTTFDYLDMDAKDLHEALGTGRSVKVRPVEGPVNDDALARLKARYAAGEIDEATFERLHTLMA